MYLVISDMSSQKKRSALIVSVSGVRGIVGESLNGEIAYRHSYAFGRRCRGLVVVGRDSRPSGVNLKKAAIHGLVDAGCEVIDLDIAPTPTIEMAVINQRAKGGVIVTASHNPSKWNGFKFLRSDGTFLRPKEIKEIFGSMSGGTYIRTNRIDNIKILDGAIEDHLNKIVQLIDREKIRKKRFSVALDTVNGAGGEIAQILLDRLNCEVFSINAEMHGDFAHWPEPTPANLESFSRFIHQHTVDVGFALDPDADRLVLALPNGNILNEEYTLAVAIDHYLGNIKKGPIVINQSTSRLNEDIAEKHACRLVRSPVGETNVVESMIEQNAVFGGEGNGGVIDPRLHLGRDALVGMALTLEFLACAEMPLSEIISNWPRYTIIKDKISTDRQIFAKIVKILKGKFKQAEISETDGIRFAWSDRWLHVRPSNTEPIIRLIAESPTNQQSKQLIEESKKLFE